MNKNNTQYKILIGWRWCAPSIILFLEPLGNPGGVLGISSERDDRMESKFKTQKNLEGFQQNPKKSLDQKLTPKKSHADFVALKSSRKE